MKISVVRGIVVLLAVTVAGALAAEAQAQVNAMHGKAKMTYTKREAVPVGDMEGHIVMVGDSSGTGANIGKWGFMDGAATRSAGTADLTRGTGSQEGYFTLSKDGNEATCRYTGTVRTVLSPEGKPVTSFSGDWKWVKCAGIYAGCTGQGVYQGAFTSENEYFVEYKGIIVQ